jgi:hypothetical protein
MASSSKQRKLQAAWSRIEALGGHGVWENDMVVVSFTKTAIKDEDLCVFRDFPLVRILNLSHTGVSDAALTHLNGLSTLETLNVTDTKISAAAVNAFRRAHPSVKVTTEPPPKGAINPFTGKPF